MPSPVTDVGVVGAGIVGLATAFSLQRQGASVTVYDPAPPGSEQSAGQSRIFRHAHDDPRLVALARWSRRLWEEWADELGTELVSRDGAVALGPTALDRLRVLNGFPDLPAREIDAGELVARMPLLAPYDGPAVLDEAGGSIRTRAAVDALAGRLGAGLVPERVMTLRTLRTGVEVRTGTTRREHAQVVVCAGRGTAGLARGIGVTIPVEPAAHVRVTFRVRVNPPARIATLQDSSGSFGETGVYAAAYPGNDRYAVGLSEAVPLGSEGGIESPDRLASLADRTAGYVARALPGLDPFPVGYVHCWVTRLPWSDDGVGLWATEGTTFVAGHNLFKLAPALGHALADHANGQPLAEHLTPDDRLGAAP